MSGLTPEQFEERRAYIGGSDAPALAGVNPPGWAQPIDVWSEKVGLREPRASSGMMALGTRMEQLVADLAAEALDARWRRSSSTYRGRYPWAGGHVDRLGDVWLPGTEDRVVATLAEPAILECKWSQRRDGWGPSHRLAWTEGEVAYQRLEAPTTEVPLHYAVQVQHYLAVTGRPLAILAVLLGYADFRWYAIRRNEPMIAGLMELEEEFWSRHVVPQVPPTPDGSESYGRHLRSLYAQDSAVEAIATPEQQLMAEELQAARAGRVAAERSEARAAQLLQESMGTTAKLTGPGFVINWRTNKPTTKVAWEELATALLEQAYPTSEPLPVALPPEWPSTKKARAQLVRSVAQVLGLSSEEPGARPFRPEFDSESSDGEES